MLGAIITVRFIIFNLLWSQVPNITRNSLNGIGFILALFEMRENTDDPKVLTSEANKHIC